ncbi:uncharacterized protein LOC111920646 [Lactuca sativa]|uniref:uncharacterized protein LOC111920646 n=1 Tax=Lactuca sativa TaxID=4236 RepID=UPI000CD98B8D|nr:uncharacterized protein LOC111920646 [Lactuca sativa]
MSYIFNDKPSVCHGYDAFTVKGFDNWKKVNGGKNCAFLKHIGCSQHRNAVAFTENLMDQEAHIENIIVKQNEAQILKNLLRLKSSIDIVRWLTFQACALRGNDESPNSKNPGNFLQLLKLIASYNDEVANVILEKAPYNFNEVGNSYFCFMVDESQDESKKEQMTIVLIFVDAEGIIRERFLDLVHIKALVLKDFPYVYYVHCFAHRLQRALVAASREIIHVHQFFSNLIFTINVVCASSKRHDELQEAKTIEIEHLLELGEIESDLFTSTLDKQLHELNSRFNDQVMELLRLSSTLVSKEHPKVINIDQICLLVEKYYPEDFREQERI